MSNRLMKNLTPNKTLAVIALSALAASIALPATAQTVFIKDGQIHTVDDGGIIQNGDIIVRDGTIVAVGNGLPQPDGATVIDAAGKIVTPGLFAPLSALGISEIGLDQEANDSSPSGESGFELSASLDALDAYNPASTLIPINRAGGVTRALTIPSPGAKMFAGQGAIIDLSGTVSSVTKVNAAQRVAMGYSGAARNGDTRMGAWAMLRAYFDEALSYAANPRDYVQRPHDGRFTVGDIKALGRVVSDGQPLMVSANRASDLRLLIRIKSKYRLNVIVIGGSEAWQVADELARANIPVILNPMFNLPAQFEDIGATLQNAKRLHEAGVTIAFYGTAAGSHNLRLLPQLAGNAVANGLPAEAALEALTLGPAKMFGLNNRLGSIAPGKIADIVVWDGDPLELSSRPEAVLINGQVMSMENRQTLLRERYKDLNRGSLPHAYRGAN